MRKGFTLLELLIVIAIIGIMATFAIIGLSGAQAKARDGRRKADLESIRSALELYRADCDVYPNAITYGSALTGTSNVAGARCSTSNKYIGVVPNDPSNGKTYRYAVLGGGSSYELCSAIEQVNGASAQTCGGSNNCGSTCYYKVTSP